MITDAEQALVLDSLSRQFLAIMEQCKSGLQTIQILRQGDAPAKMPGEDSPNTRKTFGEGKTHGTQAQSGKDLGERVRSRRRKDSPS